MGEGLEPREEQLWAWSLIAVNEMPHRKGCVGEQPHSHFYRLGQSLDLS